MIISSEEVNRLLAFSPSDHGSISSGTEAATVEEIEKVKKVVKKLPDTRSDRVQALKAQIENGTYHVSGEDIADLIIRRALADNTTL